MTDTPRPLGIAMGDPAGIGAEIVFKALQQRDLSRLQVVLFGHPSHYLGLPIPQRTWFENLPRWSSASRSELAPVFWCPVAGELPAKAPEFGAFSTEGGRIQRAALDRAIDAVLGLETQAIVTAPVNKRIFDGEPGIHGQSELLAARTRATNWAMMLTGDRLSVVLVTTHIPLSAVAAALSAEAVGAKLQVTHQFFLERQGRPPRIGLCALNPHAGEDGLCGDEESRILRPAVLAGRAHGISVSDPLPSDTLFYRAARGDFDVVLALYHDQGLIPLKLLHFADGVNVTIGLPVVRTSPDHGVAYDIAGTDLADPASMQAAIRYARDCLAARVGSA